MNPQPESKESTPTALAPATGSQATEIWVCGHTRKCKWQGRYDELVGVPDRRMGPGVTRSVCPRCGNEEFYVRKLKNQALKETDQA